MKRFVVKLLLLFMLCLFITGSTAQKDNANKQKSELYQKKKEIQKKISLTKHLISKAQKEKRKSVHELATINQQIGYHEELIKVTSTELLTIDQEIQQSEQSIKQLSENLVFLKKEYAQRAASAYKNGSALGILALIFSAENFNQAYQRYKYLKQFTAVRKRQMQNIKETQIKLKERIEFLKEAKINKNVVVQEQFHAKEGLDKTRQEKDEMVRALSLREKQLMEELEEQKREYNRLNDEIRGIVRRSAKEDEKIAATPEFKVESSNFARNKGSLPWPVTRGVIIAPFGKREHEVLKNVMINNNGIDIRTETDESVRAVFPGKVYAVAEVPNFYNVVFIQHGEFITVYTNLRDVFVSNGDKVTLTQEIGVVAQNKKTGESVLHFEIWKGKEIQNPEDWIAR